MAQTWAQWAQAYTPLQASRICYSALCIMSTVIFLLRFDFHGHSFTLIEWGFIAYIVVTLYRPDRPMLMRLQKTDKFIALAYPLLRFVIIWNFAPDWGYYIGETTTVIAWIVYVLYVMFLLVHMISENMENELK